MLAHLVHQRRSLLPAPSASAIRYATLHQEVLRCHPRISDYSYPRGYHGCGLDPRTSPVKTGRDLP
jgi:hypothetical protein